ncbi:MAG: T9SS type A sorting domain-containing protein [Bacteroidia bacterium]|nr:T9SS type A sorting domain-containing protein [Bacteroidia bacterium]
MIIYGFSLSNSRLPRIFTKSWIAAVLLLLLSLPGFAQTYCTPPYTSLCSSADFINNFTFNTLSNLNSGCNGNPNNYILYPSLTTSVTPGQTYNMTMQSGLSWSQGFGVWMDFNHDGDFNDPNEFIYASPTSSTGLYSTTVTIPATAFPGLTRLRVRCKFASTIGSTESCTSFTFGETEDYNVTVISPSPNDVGITAITAPNSGCGLTSAETVSVTITNFGTNAQTGFNVNYSVNGGAPVTQSIGSLNIAPASSVAFSFTVPANLGTAGTYNLKAWTSLGTDNTHFNDTTNKQVIAIPGVNTFPYVQDFESGQGGWISGGTNNTWAYGTPAKTVIQGAASGSKAWVTGGLGTGPYMANDNSYVIGPCFDFSSLSNPWITMNIWWASEFSWDGAVLQSSTDFGSTWQVVGHYGDPYNWYTDNSLNGNPGGQQEGWSGTGTSGSGTWVKCRHRLDNLAGQSSVRLRIAFGSDGSVQMDGFAFDDVFIGDGPVPNLGADSVQICGGDSLFLNPGTFYQYLWSTGDTTQDDTIYGGGNISVRVMDTLGFFGFDTVHVSISIPIADLGPDISKCPWDTLVLQGDPYNTSPGGTFVWQDLSTDTVYYVINGGTYFVELTDTVGCKSRDTVEVTVVATAPVNAGSDTTICIGQSLLLDAGNTISGSTYNWNTGATTQVVVVSSPGMYVVEVGFPGSCSTRDTVMVNAFPSPTVSLGPDTVICGSKTLNAGNPGMSYAWSTGSTNQSITVTNPGTYSVTVTSSNGCTGTDDVVLSFSTIPTVNLGPNQVSCNNQSITLNAGNPGMSYFWSTGATSQSITVTTPGLYIVNVTNANGCTGIDSVVINNSNLTVNLGPDFSLCGNQFAYLNAGNPGNTFSWSTGASTQIIQISQPGTYTVTVTDGIGCNATDAITVSSLPGINAAISGPSTGALYVPQQFNDISTPTAISRVWYFGDGSTSTQQNPVHSFQALTQYTVTLIVFDGNCRDTTTHTIDINSVIGIDGLEEQSLEIFPNPSDAKFTIRGTYSGVEALQVSVIDMQGRELRRQTIDGFGAFSTSIDLSGYSKGLYLLRLEAGEGALYRKLILR